MEEAANLEEAIELFSKSKYAECYTVIDENSIVCKPCGAKRTRFQYKAGKSSSATSLKNHLSKKHLININSTINLLHETVVDFFIHHNLPLSMSDCKCFRRMAETLASHPKENPPCSSTASALVSTMYNTTRSEVEQKTERQLSCCCFGPLDRYNWT